MAAGPAFESMSGPGGEQVPLENRRAVEDVLRRLHEEVATPVARHFGLQYDCFCEQHCQEKQAGVARRQPRIPRTLDEYGKVAKETTIRLRLRKPPSLGDPQKDFISRGTQLAVLLHELAHLRHMDHGPEFALLLRDIFRHAAVLGLVASSELVNEYPSSRPWENAIYSSNGDVDDRTLLRLHSQHEHALLTRAVVAAVLRACARPRAKKVSVNARASRLASRCEEREKKDCKRRAADGRPKREHQPTRSAPSRPAVARPAQKPRERPDAATLAEALRIGPQCGHLTLNSFGLDCMLNWQLQGDLPAGLRSLKVDLSAHNQVTDGDVCDLAEKIPCSLHGLIVDFRFCWNVTDTSVMAVLEKLPSSLRSLSLRGLGSCKMMTDKSLLALAHGFPEGLQELVLDFRFSANITEQSVDTLLQRLPKSLREVSLDFEDCPQVGCAHLERLLKGVG